MQALVASEASATGKSTFQLRSTDRRQRFCSHCLPSLTRRRCSRTSLKWEKVDLRGPIEWVRKLKTKRPMLWTLRCAQTTAVLRFRVPKRGAAKGMCNTALEPSRLRLSTDCPDRQRPSRGVSDHARSEADAFPAAGAAPQLRFYLRRRVAIYRNRRLGWLGGSASRFRIMARSPLGRRSAPTRHCTASASMTSDAASGEVDKIYAYDNGVQTLLGTLAGANDLFLHHLQPRFELL